jgi:Uncharacterized protein conserved in bacteria
MIRGLIFLLIITAFFSCHFKDSKQKKEDEKQSAPEQTGKMAYDLSKPAQKWVLPAELIEISGNTWIDNNHLLVIEDLHPNLYYLKLDKDVPTIEKTIPFEAGSDKKVDIEDVTSYGNAVYALWSHGVIYKITDWNNHPTTKELPTSLDKKNNTEGICADPVTGNLLVACKNESGIEDAKKSSRAIYEFDLRKEKLNTDPFFVIQKKDLKEAIGEKIEFNPSGIAVHPETNDIYILSTKGTKGLLEYSHDGKFKAYQPIDEDLMPQPEGICFAPDGKLYISTEGKHGVPARLYLFTANK